MDPTACNFNVNATDPSICQYAQVGLDCAGNCLLDADADGICNFNEVSGCQDVSACNFNVLATDPGNCIYPEMAMDCNGLCLLDSDDDGICDQSEVVGCQQIDACNFNPLATDSGVCQFPSVGYNCQGVCVLDTDADGVCDVSEIFGCTDISACNYLLTATEDAGNCSYPDAVIDCFGACWNDVDLDGTCDEWEVLGCMDSLACDYAELATDSGACNYPIAEICNDFDDDCDDLVDEDLVFVNWYLDNDVDGFGQDWVAFSCVDPPVGWSSDSTDCDDGNALISPNAPEIVDNNVDENCDGTIELAVTEWSLSDWKLYPNPLLQDCFYLEVPFHQCHVLVFNEMGAKVLELNWSKGDCIEIQQHNGLYRVVMMHQQTVQSHSIVVSR
jgi:hypothetical protein